MLRKRKDNSDYEIDRELTWKFAIEKNVEYQEKIEELEEENKKLKEENEILEHKVKFLEGEIDLYQKLHEKSLSVEWEPDLYEDIK